MPVKKQEANAGENRQTEKSLKEKEDQIADFLMSSLDLPEEKVKPGEGTDSEGGRIDTKDKPITRDELEEMDEIGDEPESESEDDVIPRSKYERKIQASRARERALEARVKELEERTVKTADSRRNKLEAMNEAELKQLKRTVRTEWKSTDDPTREQELVALEEDIEDVILRGPQRFQEKQLKSYERTATKVMTDPENADLDFEQEGENIRGIAQAIYSKYPAFHKLEDGQSIALEMAVEHFRENKKTLKGKSREDELKRQNTDLKRKTSLDSSKVKGESSRADLRKLYENAKRTRSMYDQAAYLDKILDVDMYLEGERRR